MATSNVSGPLVCPGGFVGPVTGAITGNITGNVTGTVSGGITSGATATEINARTDDSAMVDTITAAGAISTTTCYTAINSTAGTFAATLAVPTKPALIKVIKMTVDNGDVTIALTNVVGGTAASTATFDAVGETLVLVSDAASGKWVVLAEVGVTLS